MTLDHFWHTLQTNSGYQSPRKALYRFRPLPRWAAAIVYYTQLITLILRDALRITAGSPYSRRLWAESSLQIMEMVESVGGLLRISGLHSCLVRRGPVVYIANHMSMLDTFVLPGILLLRGDIRFVVKEELLRYPFFGRVLSATDPIAVSRRNPRQDLKTVLSSGLAHLRKGCSIVIFPQATRNAVFDPAEFNSLGVKLALRAGVPIVPIALKTDFQGNGRLIRELGPVTPAKTVHVCFGAPMKVATGAQSAPAHRKVVAFIVNKLQQHGGSVRESV